MDDPTSLPPPHGDRPLPHVIEDLRRGLRPAGGDESDDWFVYERAFQHLVAWARASGCFYDDLQPQRFGGREHDVTFDPSSQSWLKFTKPAAAGYLAVFDAARGRFELETGLPLPYLERLELQNILFQDTLCFVGVSGPAHRPRIITRQLDVDGAPATLDAITAMMVGALGFVALPARFALGYASSLTFARRDAVVFDLRPANVVQTPDGILAPIDCIPARLDDAGRAALARWVD